MLDLIETFKNDFDNFNSKEENKEEEKNNNKKEEKNKERLKKVTELVTSLIEIFQINNNSDDIENLIHFFKENFKSISMIASEIKKYKLQNKKNKIINSTFENFKDILCDFPKNIRNNNHLQKFYQGMVEAICDKNEPKKNYYIKNDLKQTEIKKKYDNIIELKGLIFDDNNNINVYNKLFEALKNIEPSLYLLEENEILDLINISKNIIKKLDNGSNELNEAQKKFIEEKYCGRLKVLDSITHRKYKDILDKIAEKKAYSSNNNNGEDTGEEAETDDETMNEFYEKLIPQIEKFQFEYLKEREIKYLYDLVRKTKKHDNLLKKLEGYIKKKCIEKYNYIVNLSEEFKTKKSKKNELFSYLDTITFDFLDDKQKNDLINIYLEIYHELTFRKVY